MKASGAAKIVTSVKRWRDSAGRDQLTAIVKAAFSLAPGLMKQAPEPRLAEQAADLAGELAPLKAQADVIVVGSLGASDQRRLLRLGIARGPEVLLDKALVAVREEPTLVSPDRSLPWFGTWPREKTERPAEVRELLADDLPTLSDDLDAVVFQQAPPDQRLPYLLGGEQLLLEGMHPDHPALRCRLPALHAWARLCLPAGAREIPLVGDTLVIDLDRMLACVLWRGFVDIEDDDDDPEVEAGLVPIACVEEVRGEPPAWRSGAKPADAPKPFAPANLSNRRPLSVATLPWQRNASGWERALIVKGSFDIVDGAVATLAESQLPIEGDRLDARGGLVHCNDAVPFKPRADVLLMGSAYRPSDKDVALVTLELGPVSKSVVAIGDRSWRDDGVLSKPKRFESIPLSYDHAFGGNGYATNPLGTGVNLSEPPNLELPDHLITRQTDEPPPAGFAPLPLDWRQGERGTYDETWLESAWPAPPDDFDFGLFNAAPRDQQCPYLRGDEPFAAHNVCPGGRPLNGQLPAATVRAWAERREGSQPELVPLVLDTVTIDAEARRLVLVWRGSVLVADDEATDLKRLLVVMGNDSSDDAAWGMLQLASHRPPRPRKPASRLVGATLSEGLPAPALLTAESKVVDLVILPKPPRPASRSQLESWLASPEGFAGRDLTGADLRGLDLRDRDLTGALLANACLDGVVLDGANAEEANLKGASAEGASFRKAKLARADATGARLAQANFEGADLEQAIFDEADLSGASLRNIDAAGISLIAAALDKAVLDDAKLPRADLSKATLTELSARRATLDDAKLYEASGEGACFDEASLVDARLDKADLSTLSACDLRGEGSIWEDAKLEKARLLRSDLKQASFVGTKLDGALLSDADATSACFRNTTMVGASLLRTNLMQANFEKADLRKADLRGANLYQAETWQARLEGANLELAHVAGTKLEEK